MADDNWAQSRERELLDTLRGLTEENLRLMSIVQAQDALGQPRQDVIDMARAARRAYVGGECVIPAPCIADVMDAVQRLDELEGK